MDRQIAQTDHNLETQILIGCSRTTVLPAQVEQVSTALNQNPDWAYLFKIAERNAVLPLVSSNLIEHFALLLPNEIKNNLTDGFQKQIRYNLFLTGNLIKIVKLLCANDIPVIPFKGPLLANKAYKNLAFRRYIDLDILVQPADLKKTISLLDSLDYTPVTDSYWLENIDLCIKQKKDIKFVNKDNNVYIELHWRLSRPYFDMPVAADYLWRQAETETLAGTEVSTLAFSHLLIYLCLHGTKHAWARLAWICDINELVNSTEPIDWKDIFEEAGKLGCKKILYLGLFLAYEFFGLEIKSSEWEKIKIDETLKLMALQVRARIFADELIQLDISENYAYQLKLKEKFRDRWKLHTYYSYRYLQIVFSPNEIDKELFYLPSLLTPLYYALRPVRLLYNYLGGQKK